MADEIANINKKIQDGYIVITNEGIINNQNEKAHHVDAITAPTMSTLFANASKKFLEEKERKKKELTPEDEQNP